MASSFKMDNLRAATKRLGAISKKAKADLVREAARGFLNGKSRGGARYGIIAITPPASQGVAGTAAKKAGEATITKDVSRIFKPQTEAGLAAFDAMFNGESRESFGHRGAKPLGVVRARVLRSLAEMLAWHKARRVKGTGRVLNINRDVTTGLRRRDLAGLDLGLVSRPNYAAFLAKLKANVGLLAAGWNAAARALKVAVPAWIKRHGEANGSHSVVESGGKITITLTNEVKFIGNVKSYERRVDAALQYQANAMNRQADYLMKKNIREAGF